MSHGNSRFNDSGISLISKQITHELIIDLDFVEAKQLEEAQAGIACSKVIRSQQNPQLSNVIEDPAGRGRTIQKTAFSKLQLQHARPERIAFQRLLNNLRQPRLTQLPCRDIDGNEARL